VLAWSARGVCKLRREAHSAGACRKLCVEAVFRLCGQPLPCPLSRWGKAAAAHLHASFSKACSSTAPCTPLQRLWGSRAHTPTHTHRHARTGVLAQTHGHTHTRTNTRTHMCAYTHTHTLHMNTRVAQTARYELHQLFSAACDAPSFVT
jgi:hypothetical protein